TPCNVRLPPRFKVHSLDRSIVPFSESVKLRARGLAGVGWVVLTTASSRTLLAFAAEVAASRMKRIRPRIPSTVNAVGGPDQLLRGSLRRKSGGEEPTHA